MLPFLDLKPATAELREDLDRAIARVLDSGQYILGEEVESFEREFAAYCGARHGVGAASGLDALVLILRGYGIGVGDEVIVPSNTYIATWLAVSAVGARVVPVEPDPATYNLDPERAERAITAHTRAILAVHLYGHPANLNALARIAAHHGLKLIADAAQAHGARYQGLPCNRLADASAFSFYPTKNLGALGDAGAVVTDDAVLADDLRVRRNYGSRQKYFNAMKGINSRLDPLQAAVLRVKLKKVDEWNQRRRQIAKRYCTELEGVPDLTLPRVAENCRPVWHVFAVRHPARAQFRARLHNAGIGTLVHYPVPPHLSEAYADAGFRHGDFPIAEELASTELSLPIGPHLAPEQVAEVIDAVRRIACREEAA